MTRTIVIFLDTKTVISSNKNSQSCLKIFQFSRKASAAPCQRWNIMAQISIDTLNRERVILIVDIENMLPWKDHIQIPIVSIGTITFRLRTCIDYPLDCPGRFVPAHDMAYNLPRFPAHHCYDVNIFPCLCPGPAFQKPVQLIQFHSFRFCCGILFTHSLNGLFLSNSLH